MLYLLHYREHSIQRRKHLHYRWWLGSSPTRPNENLELEFLGAWEPTGNLGPPRPYQCEDPNIVFLQETKLNISSFQRVKKWMGFRNGLEIESEGRSGGIALMWKEEVELEVKNFSKHHIHAKFQCRTKKKGRLTRVYGHLEASKQEQV